MMEAFPHAGTIRQSLASNPDRIAGETAALRGLPDWERPLTRAESQTDAHALRVFLKPGILSGVLPVIVAELHMRRVCDLVGGAQATLVVVILSERLTNSRQFRVASVGRHRPTFEG